MTFEPLASDFYAYESLLTDREQEALAEPPRLARGRRQADRRRLLGPGRVPDAGREAARRARHALVRVGRDAAVRELRGVPRLRAARARPGRCVGRARSSACRTASRRARSACAARRSSARSGSPGSRRGEVHRRVRAHRAAVGLRLRAGPAHHRQPRRRPVGAERREALDRQRHVLGHHDHLGEGRRGRPGRRASSCPPPRPATRRRRSRARSACAPCRTPTSRSTDVVVPESLRLQNAELVPRHRGRAAAHPCRGRLGARWAPPSAPTRRR